MDECSRCDDLRRYIRDLKEELETTREEFKEEYKKRESAEYEVRQLEPYKKASEKAYDNYVSTPRDMP